MSIDVEEWFHILNCSVTPDIKSWGSLESGFQRNLETLLAMVEETNTRATLFWLGWMGERGDVVTRAMRSPVMVIITSIVRKWDEIYSTTTSLVYETLVKTSLESPSPAFERRGLPWMAATTGVLR